MHFGAKRGIAIACPPSICLSVCDVGGSGPRRSVILETNCMDTWPNTFALRSPKAIHLLPGEHGEILVELEVGREKVVHWSTKAAISLKRIKIQERLLWKAYRNSPTLFPKVPWHSRPPRPPLLKTGVRNPHPKLQSLLSQERVKLRTSNLARTIGSIRKKAH